MAIRVACPQCGQAYALAEAKAGKTVQCRKCGGAIAVPSLSGGYDELEIIDNAGPVGPAGGPQPWNAPLHAPWAQPNAGYAPPGAQPFASVAPAARESGSTVLWWAIGATGGTVVLLIAAILALTQWRSGEPDQVAQQPAGAQKTTDAKTSTPAKTAAGNPQPQRSPAARALPRRPAARQTFPLRHARRRHARRRRAPFRRRTTFPRRPPVLGGYALCQPVRWC